MGATKNEMVRGYTNTYAFAMMEYSSEDDSSSSIIVDPIIALKRGFYRKRFSNDACFSPTESVGENGRNDGQTIAFRLHIWRRKSMVERWPDVCFSPSYLKAKIDVGTTARHLRVTARLCLFFAYRKTARAHDGRRRKEQSSEEASLLVDVSDWHHHIIRHPLQCMPHRHDERAKVGDADESSQSKQVQYEKSRILNFKIITC